MSNVVCQRARHGRHCAIDPAKRLRLRAGDVLIFQEKLGPLTGDAADADPSRRHAVRLMRVNPTASVPTPDTGNTRTPGPLLTDTLFDQPYVEIEWAPDDALPFPLCISSKTDKEHGRKVISDVSVALGNIVLADHGRSVQQEIAPVPSADPRFVRVPAQRAGRCASDDELETERERLQILPRFRPVLNQGPLTQTGGVLKPEIVNGQTKLRRKAFDPGAPATAAFQWKMDDVLPAITLADGSRTWNSKRDLFGSSATDPDFVAEVENDGTTELRFGDGLHGQRPEPSTSSISFSASYRIGNGASGNVGADSIVHFVTKQGGIIAVTNPLPASGGIDPESMDDVRRRAPFAFRSQERAVTPEDYAEVAERHPQILRAAATFRSTGSWQTVFVTVDRRSGLEVDSKFKDEMRRAYEAVPNGRA